ncbi:MAG: hypothetical protein WCG05_05415 [Alphaproteobacteria bacterium]
MKKFSFFLMVISFVFGASQVAYSLGFASSQCQTYKGFKDYENAGKLYKGEFRRNSQCLKTFCNKFCAQSCSRNVEGVKDCLTQCSDILSAESYKEIVACDLKINVTQVTSKQYEDAMKEASESLANAENALNAPKQARQAAKGAAQVGLQPIEGLLSQLSQKISARNKALEAYNSGVQSAGTDCSNYRKYKAMVDQIYRQIAAVKAQILQYKDWYKGVYVAAKVGVKTENGTEIPDLEEHLQSMEDKRDEPLSPTDVSGWMQGS